MHNHAVTVPYGRFYRLVWKAGNNHMNSDNYGILHIAIPLRSASSSSLASYS